MVSKVVFKSLGFTLIELLVSLLVISILVGLGYANFRKYSQKQALWSVARQIEGDLRLAQSYAMSGKDASICSPGYYLYGYQILRVDNLSYKIQRVCRNPQNGNNTSTDVSNRTLSSNFEIYNSFSILFKAVDGGVETGGVINVRRISTTNPYIVITVSASGTISISYNE